MEENMSMDNVTQKEFAFPLNIKQMGAVDSSLRVYMEDYVYTYLYQYAKNESNPEKLAVLVGEHTVHNGEDITFISGAIEARNTETNGSKVSFTEESWNHINRQIEMYFKDLSIVGWVHIQPDFGTYLMPEEEAFHKECFKENWQVLFVMDPSERSDGFYALENSMSMKQLRGYFIYYDKNESMQNYMIDNNSEKKKILIEEEEKISFGQSAARFFGFDKIIETKDDKPNDRIDAAGKIRNVLNRKETQKFNAHRRRQVAMTAFCGLACAAVIGMFGNIINSNTRLKSIESQMIVMQDNYYSELAKIIEGVAEETTTRVFAEQNAKIEEEQETRENEQNEAEYETVALSDEFMADTRYNVYWVEEGDNLWLISTKFYGSSDKVDVIMEANGLSDENLIYYGEKLIIPREP